MSHIDLYGELGTAICVGGSEKMQGRIKSYGLTCPLVGVRRVRIEKQQWIPDPDGGEPFLVYPVLQWPHLCDKAFPQSHTKENLPPRDIGDEMVPVVDLMAWRPDRAGFYLRCGSVFALGEWHLHMPSEAEPLRLYSEVTPWLAHGCDGVVVVDWKIAAYELLAWRKIKVDSVALGHKLEEELTKARKRLTPRMPEILVFKRKKEDATISASSDSKEEASNG